MQHKTYVLTLTLTAACALLAGQSATSLTQAATPNAHLQSVDFFTWHSTLEVFGWNDSAEPSSARAQTGKMSLLPRIHREIRPLQTKPAPISIPQEKRRRNVSRKTGTCFSWAPGTKGFLPPPPPPQQHHRN
jgi:hypothetical protein